MIRVYVAGPLYSSGLSHDNVRAAVEAGDALMRKGFHPFVPHLGHFAHMIGCGWPEQKWLELDKAWLLACDAVLRLPGDSRGADLEEKWAKEAGIPVFRSIADIVDWYSERW